MKVLVFCDQKTPRVEYAFGLLFKELLGCGVIFTTDRKAFMDYEAPRLWYSAQEAEVPCKITPAGLLSQRGIDTTEPEVVQYQEVSCLYPVLDGDLPYDPFSAAFYLVTRYEEYLPFRPDSHGRFPASESFASRKQFLHIPVVNHYAVHIKTILQQCFVDFFTGEPKYRFTLTIDIDAAWAIRHKGLVRMLGGVFNDLRRGSISDLKRRFRVLSGKENDPFDTFNILFTYQRRMALDLKCFILLGDYSRYDKNIRWNNIHFQDLIRRIGDYAELGIHPSWESFNDNDRLAEEIHRLSSIIRRPVMRSRQHFLRLSMPVTYRSLLANGIREDYTMGYADDYGFRAGICTPYFFYDLEKEQITPLRIFPFAFMDGTLHDYLKKTPDEAIKVIDELLEEVKKVNGHFIGLWHNESLSEAQRWKGWKAVCDHMINNGKAK